MRKFRPNWQAITRRLEPLQRRLAPLRQRLAAHWGILAGVFWILLLGGIAQTDLILVTSSNANQPFHYRVRELLKKDPPLDPKLKILSFDDVSADRLQRNDLLIDDWATLLTAIAKQEPREIIIDKIFQFVNDPLGTRATAIERIRDAGVPIIVGSFASEVPYKTRNPLDLSSERYQLKAMMGGSTDESLDLKRFRGWHIYGPHPDIASAFFAAGHILYYGEGFVNPVLQPSPEIIFPHATLMNERITVMDGRLYINGIKLPTDRNGQILVNLSNEDAYYERHKRLGNAVLAARQGKQVSNITTGDTVLILPEMYTGSTDFKKTPLGTLPGGFVLASMVNSVLTNQWLGVMPGIEFQLLLLGMLGLFWGATRQSITYWTGLLLLTLGVVGAGIYFFCFRNQLPDTVMHVAAFVGCSTIMFVERQQRREKEHSRVAGELNEAAEMAKAFRPDEVPAWPFCQIASYHKSFSEASGDWFSFRKSSSGRFHHFVLVDVTGHGVQAALMVSTCKTVLAHFRERSETVESAEFLVLYARVLNEMLYHHGKGRQLLTLIGITFDAHNLEAHFLSAGHPPPILYTVDDQGKRSVKSLATRSTVLGLTDTFKGKMRSQKLKPGDEVLAYTDGLPVGQHLRPLNRFMTEMRNEDFAADPTDLLKTLWDAEYEKTRKTLDDDVSIVWFRMGEATKPAEKIEASDALEQGKANQSA